MQRAANAGSEPGATDAAVRSNVRYHKSDQKRSTTARVLDGVYGSVNQGVLGLCLKAGFLVLSCIDICDQWVRLGSKVLLPKWKLQRAIAHPPY